jgi:hypothetical protein
MIVKRITDMADIMNIIPIEVRLRVKEKTNVPVKDILAFLNVQLPNPLFAVWMVADGEDIAGYVFTLINTFSSSSNREMMILRIWYDQHKKEAIRLLVEVMREWVKENKIKNVRIEVKKGLRAFQKKWGFKPVSVIMERRV